MIAFLVLLVSLFLFYPKMFLVLQAPLSGDHGVQHFPWAYLLASHLKRLEIPFWTPEMQFGFPIAAESQIGIFYLPNLILYGLLPFRMAYSYMNLVHFLLSGMGMYTYAKKMKLSSISSFVAAFIFVFGAAYGGAYYNMTSLKTIAWLPSALCAFEYFYQDSSKKALALTAVLIGMSSVAGYLQIAVLTWTIFTLYCFLRIFLFRAPKAPPIPVSLAGLALSFSGALLIALPQLYLSYGLALQSNRVGLTEGYAYVGSLPPLALLTVVNPYAQAIFHHTSFYGGMFGFVLVLAACFSKQARHTELFKLWALIAAFACLLALGRWTPVYPLLIKMTRFYSFRVPAKFLVFTCFGFSLLAAIGFEQMWRAAKAKKALSGPLFRVYCGTLLLVSGLWLGAYALVRWGRPWALALGDWYIRKFIYLQPGHPHSLKIYADKLVSSLAHKENILRLDRPELLWIAATWLAGGIWIWAARKRMTPKWLFAGLIFLGADLFGASWFYIQYDLGSYKDYFSPSPIVAYLVSQKKTGRLGRLYGFSSFGGNLPLRPNADILYGIEDIGAYSPFVLSRYHETIGQFGSTNDSNYASIPSEEFVLRRLGLLSALHVSHILSDTKIDSPGLALRVYDPATRTYVYENARVRPGAFFVNKLSVMKDWSELKAVLMAEGFDPTENLLLETSEAQKAVLPEVTSGKPKFTTRLLAGNGGPEEWEITTDRGGFFVISRTMYPGWEAVLNGKSTPILKAYGLFQCVLLPGPGQYRLALSYHPF